MNLVEESLLLTSHNCSFRNMLLADFSRKGIMPKIALETSSKEILKQFAVSGLGVAFMPDMTVVEEVKSGKLVRLNWTGDDFPIYSQVFIHKDKHMTGAIEGFLRLIELS